jgi:hypothetical protein
MDNVQKTLLQKRLGVFGLIRFGLVLFALLCCGPVKLALVVFCWVVLVLVGLG